MGAKALAAHMVHTLPDDCGDCRPVCRLCNREMGMTDEELDKYTQSVVNEWRKTRRTILACSIALVLVGLAVVLAVARWA